MGPGAGPLMTEYLLPTIMGKEPQQRMARALKLGREVDWVMAAERAIGGKLANCDWHLEDPDGNTINDDDWDGPPLALDALKLLESPQGELPLDGPDGVGRRMSRRQFLLTTSRHLGLAGNAGWYLDQLDPNGCPHALLYIRPDRLTPYCDKRDVVQDWILDKKPGNPGTPLGLENLLLLQFQPPDMGVFGMGLIEASMAKAINNGLVDRHYSSLLASGGRISGIISPKDGAIHDDEVYKQLVRDWRNVTEQPEAARRLQVIRAPVEFIQTVMGVGEMQIIDLMYHNRDALLALWGVPLSQLGGTAASGLNSGETRKYDEAALWQGAVEERLNEVQEATQAILDRWETVLGWAPKLCFDKPEFDDEAPQYEMAKNAQGLPLRNAERRKLVGLDPFGDDELDNQIWMPVQVVAMAQAPDEDGKWPEASGRSTLKMVDNAQAVPQQPGTMATATPATAPAPGGGAPPAAGPKGAGASVAATKAAALAGDLRTLNVRPRRLRDNMERTVVPRLKAAVQDALESQADDIAKAVERNWSAIVKHDGNDETQWWREGQLGRVLKPAAAGISEAVVSYVLEAAGQDSD